MANFGGSGSPKTAPLRKSCGLTQITRITDYYYSYIDIKLTSWYRDIQLA